MAQGWMNGKPIPITEEQVNRYKGDVIGFCEDVLEIKFDGTVCCNSWLLERGGQNDK